MTTGEASISRKIRSLLLEKSIHFVDAPVSGGPKGAREGTIAIMAGCEKDHFKLLKPYLELLVRMFFMLAQLVMDVVLKLVIIY